MDNNIVYVIVAGVLGLIFAFWKKSWIEDQDEGTDQMKKIQRPFVDKQEFQKSLNLKTQEIKNCLKDYVSDESEEVFKKLNQEVHQEIGTGLLDWFKFNTE